MISSQRHAHSTDSTGPTSQRARAPRGASLVSQSFGLSDRGQVRPGNEDQFLIAALARALWIEQSTLSQQQVRYADAAGKLFVVADGMGGAAGGAQASALALGTIEDFLLTSLRWLFALGEPSTGNAFDVLDEFKSALRSADAQVCDAARRHPELKGMGTTLTMAYAHGAELFLAHVGDSRAYVHRAGALHQLTRDHTFVQELVEHGVIPPEDVPQHDMRHVITNVVGGPSPGVKVEVQKVDLNPGDVLLLCTDGLTEMVSDHEIEGILRNQRVPRAACEQLIALANAHGGRDNVTAVVARFDGDRPS